MYKIPKNKIKSLNQPNSNINKQTLSNPIEQLQKTQPIPRKEMHPNESQFNRQSSIYPYYKPDNIFQRDQAYYEQLQKNTRRNNQSSLIQQQSVQWPRYQQVETQFNNLPVNYGSSQQYGYQQTGGVYSTVQNVPIPSQSQTQFNVDYTNQSFGQSHEPLSPSFSRVDPNAQTTNTLVYSQQQNLAQNLGASNPELNSSVNQANYRTEAEENRKLKQRLDDLINFKDQFDDGSEVKKKFHYNKDSNEGRTIMSQEEQVQRLLGVVKRNNNDIGRYRNAILELQKSMNNIQSVDREIYKQLKNLSNRDQELLDRATAALARGASREEIAAILERVIS